MRKESRRPDHQNKASVLKILKKTLSYVGKDKKIFYAVMLIVIVTSLLGLFIPLLIGKAVDYIPEISKGEPIASLVQIIIIIIALYLVQALLAYIENILSAKFSLNIVTNLKNDFFAKICRLKISYIEACRHGDLISRGTNDVDAVVNVLSEVIFKIIANCLIFVGCIVIMIYENLTLTLVCLISGMVTFVFTRIVSRIMLQKTMQQQIILGQLTGVQEDTFHVLKDIKYYNREDLVIEKYKKQSTSLRDKSVECLRTSSLVAPVNNLIGNLNFVLVALIGCLMAIEGSIQVGVIVVFILYVRYYTESLNTFSDSITVMQTFISSATRVFEILDREGEDTEENNHLDLNGDISLEDVEFSYIKDKPVLKGINMHVSPGQKIAIVGESGCGKTTLINLLSKYYEPDSGNIIVDGQNLKTIPIADIRKNIITFMQDDFVFDESIDYNLRYGATKDEVVDDDFEEKIKDLFNQEVSSLSMGQMQLICVLRSLYVPAKIVVFDESMSAVDLIQQDSINQILKKMYKDSTVITITHMLPSIKDSDNIFVIKNGQVVESGLHNELINKKEYYYNLYKHCCETKEN